MLKKNEKKSKLKHLGVRKSVNFRINKYLQDISMNYLQTQNLLIIESLTEHNAIEDRLFRTLINSKFQKKITLTGKTKNKLFKGFKSKALANASICIMVQKEKSIEQLVKDIKELNQHTDLIIKSLIYDWTMIDFNSENFDIFYQLSFLQKKMIYLSLLLIFRRIIMFFDIINNVYLILNNIISNKKSTGC